MHRRQLARRHRRLEQEASRPDDGTAALAQHPVEKVFNTYELLERILIGVDDPAIVLLSQRVNKTFQHVIARSLGLQRKLFFKPATVEQYLAVQTSIHSSKDEEPIERLSGYAVNPFFVDRGSCPEQDSLLLLWEGSECAQVIKLEGIDYGVYFTTPTSYSTYDDVEESWKKMVLVHYEEGAELLDAFPRVFIDDPYDGEESRLDDDNHFGEHHRVQLDKETVMGPLWDEWEEAFEARKLEREDEMRKDEIEDEGEGEN